MKKTLLVLALLLQAGSAAATDAFSLSLNQNATNNLFQTRYAESDQLALFSLSWDRSFRALSLYADGDFSYISNNTDLSYFRTNAGIDVLRALSPKAAFYLFLEGGLSMFRPGFDDFNYAVVRANAAFKAYISSTSILKVSSLSEYRPYRQKLFDHVSQWLSASIDKFFRTRTTLKLEAAWGLKHFLHPFLVQPSLDPSPIQDKKAGALGMNANAGFRPQWRPGGPGRPDDPRRPDNPGGGGGSDDSGGHQGPGGPGGSDGSGGSGSSGGPGNPSPGGQYLGFRGGIFQTVPISRGQSIQVASISGLIAQGLGEKVGLRVSAIRQWNVAGSTPFLSVEEYYMIENPTYDSFSWQGYALSGQLTAELPWNFGLKLGYTMSEKEFPGIGSLDLEGAELGSSRRDDRRQVEVRLEKSLQKFSIFLYYAYVLNASNDPLFAWNGYFVSGGLTWNFSAGRKQ